MAAGVLPGLLICSALPAGGRTTSAGNFQGVRLASFQGAPTFSQGTEVLAKVGWLSRTASAKCLAQFVRLPDFGIRTKLAAGGKVCGRLQNGGMEALVECLILSSLHNVALA